MATQPVLSSLLPVFLLIGIGLLARRVRWIEAAGAKDLSNLVFLVLTPPLLFRTMSGVRLQALDFRPLLAYFLAAGLVFFGSLALRGFNRRSAVLSLAASYSNLVMIGIPLVGLAYGQAGLVVFFTLVSVHALVLLTTGTVVLELADAREARAVGQASHRPMAHTVMLAVRNSLLHPVPLPILGGLLFAQTGWPMPQVIDKTLQLLGMAFGPLALLLVGVTLASTPVGALWRGALALTAIKNFLLPALVLAIGWALGVTGLPLTIMAVAAALPVGANVFLFSQRYRVAEDLVTASVALSTALALVSLTLVMSLPLAR